MHILSSLTLIHRFLGIVLPSGQWPTSYLKLIRTTKAALVSKPWET
jgi:hypothetical protein